MRGLKRGLIVGLVLAAIVFFLPDSVLGAITVGTGLSSVLAAAAPPLGMTARAALAVATFIPAFALTFWLIRRRRSEWDMVDDLEPAPLSAAEQMDSGPSVTEKAYTPPPSVAPAAATASADIGDRLARIEAALAALPDHIEQSIQATGSGDATAVLARVEALESQIGERLAAIDARLAMQTIQGSTGGLRKPAQADKAIAGIRRSLDGGGA